MTRIKRHLTYANVVATLALCIAVAGGSAWAAGKINGKQLKPKSVGTKAIANQAITGPKLAFNSVTKDAIAPNSIGAQQLKPLATVNASSTGPNTPAIAICPPNTQIQGGGGQVTSGGGSLIADGPSQNGWFASTQTGGTVSATAYCAPN